MKVLYIASSDSKYGAAKSLVDVMRFMKKNYQVEPVLLTRRRDHINELCDKMGIENYVFWNRDIMAGSAYSSFLYNIAKHIVKYALFLYGGIIQSQVKKIGLDFSSIDLIHSNLNRNDIGAYIAREYDIPHIWHLRELGKEDYRVRFYKRNCIEYLNKNADAFIAISKCVKQAWVTYGLFEDRIYTVYNGINVHKFLKRKKRNDNKIKIVMTGHIQETKGQDQLISAVGLLGEEYKQKIEVDFYGEAYSDYQKKLNNLISKFDLNNIVHFCGYCDSIFEKLAEYDIGIICSKAEGFGRVTVEYMAAGLAVIAADTGANPELIEDGNSGVLYSYGHPESLSDKIKLLIDNEDIREKISNVGMKHVYDCFTSEINVREIFKIYQILVNDSKEKIRGKERNKKSG